jgi:electron transport complex protein RnfE
MNMPPSTTETSARDTLLRGVWRENPNFVMLLGMCPTLAVSNSVQNSLAMGLATGFVLVCSSALISLVRNVVPKQVRIATYIVIIATFVTVVDYVIQAISLSLYLALGAFIQLIVVNCIILGRAEAFASKNPVGLSILDAIGMSVGFMFSLLCLGSVRELLGNGSLLGFRVLGEHFEPWSLMILPPGGFFVLGGWLLFFSWLKRRKAAQIAADERLKTS